MVSSIIVPAKSVFFICIFWIWQIFPHSHLESSVWGQRKSLTVQIVKPTAALWLWFWAICINKINFTWFIWHFRASSQQQQPAFAAVSQCSGVQQSYSTTCRCPAQELLWKSFNVVVPPKLMSCCSARDHNWSSRSLSRLRISLVFSWFWSQRPVKTMTAGVSLHRVAVCSSCWFVLEDGSPRKTDACRTCSVFSRWWNMNQSGSVNFSSSGFVCILLLTENKKLPHDHYSIQTHLKGHSCMYRYVFDNRQRFLCIYLI